MGNFHAQPPRSGPGLRVLFIERPDACNCTRRFDADTPMPPELGKALGNTGTWEEFANDIHDTVDEFWNPHIGLAVMLGFMMCFCFGIPTFFGLGVLAAQKRETITSNGTPQFPYCTYNSTYCPLPDDCARELCKSAELGEIMTASFVTWACKSPNCNGMFHGGTCTPNTTRVADVTNIGEVEVTAECSYIPIVVAGGFSAVVMVIFPLIIVCVFGCTFMTVGHNQSVDNKINFLVRRLNQTTVPSGVEIQYLTMYTGYCKPKHARPWRCITIRDHSIVLDPRTRGLGDYDSDGDEYDEEAAKE